MSRPHSVFDFGYDGLDYPLVNSTAANWVYFTPLLPQADIPLPEKLKLPQNQVLMAPPTSLRLASLLVTNSLFDLGLLLRVDELAAAAKTTEFHILLGSMLAMSRMSFVMLPCSKEGAFPGQGYIKKAVRRAVAQTKDLGIHVLDVEVKEVAVFKHPKCARALLQVTANKIHRGVRLKWCFYPLATKYDLVYRRNEWVQLVHRYLQQYTRAGGDKVKVIRRWKASMNMADVVGWGVTKAQLEVLLWDMLRIPSCPDPAVQNWLMTEGGYADRIDPNQQAIKGKHPEASSYVEFLRLQLCLSKLGPWKQVERKEGLLHETIDGKYRFAVSKFFSKNVTKEGKWDDMVPEDTNEYPHCPMCKRCVRHAFPVYKMWRHGNETVPPPECHECYRCQREHYLGSGIPIQRFSGCTDVDGVDSDDTTRREYCDNSQLEPLQRPSMIALCNERKMASERRCRPASEF